MENNEQSLKYDENIGLYDHINPILNIKDLNRKQVKELAKEIANNESQTHSWQEVLNGAVNYDSKNERQEKRFKRIFNKQLNENLAPVLEKQHKQELIDRMKSGDASAMSQWTTEGIDKFGHQFMPVMLTAATLPFGVGAFGQAANTMGLLPALGAETSSWGLGYGGYKLGSKLDDDFGTNWIAPVTSITSGIGGYGAGYKGMVKIGSRGWLPKGDKFMYGSQFVGDVATDVLNKGINPKSTIQKYRLSKLMDLNTSDSFVKDNLWFSTLDDDASNIFIHGDGAATGLNDYKKVDNIGGHPLTSMKGLPHFKDKHLVPANTDIEITGGVVFNKDTHPIFWSKYRPWHETSHIGRKMPLTQKARDLNDDWKKVFELGEDGWSTNHPYRYVTIDSSDLPIKFTEGLNTDEFYPHSVEYFSGKVPMEKLKGYEWDPLLKTWGKVQYVDPSEPTSKGAYTWFERPSKLTWEERLGIPKGERNQPGKPRSPRATEYDIVDGRPTKEFLDDYRAYVEALKTGGSRVDITNMFDSSWYRQRLLNQGLTEEQADQLILRLKDRVSPENLVVVDGLNSVRNFRRVEDGIPIEMTPERLTEFGRHTTGPGLSGKSLISLTTKADPEEIILHEIGGHRSQPLVADFKDAYLDQSLTSLGLKRHMKIGAPVDYGLNWGEVRARALTIAKQMSDAGWNPNSPEQVNVWLNKHIFTNGPKNANQGALYYDRPRFIKAVATGLKQGGKIENDK